MKQQKIQTIAELAFSQALVDQLLPKTKTGRLKSLYVKLDKELSIQFRKLKKISDAEKRQAKKLIIQFADLTKWEGKPLHICTKVNFLLAMYDEKEYADSIIKILIQIYEYFDRSGFAPKPCEWSAALALNKWEKIIDENSPKE